MGTLGRPLKQELESRGHDVWGTDLQHQAEQKYYRSDVSNFRQLERVFEQDYDYMSGTSQATPFVSALAALLFSEHPDWDASQVTQEIENWTADIAKQNPQLAAKGWLGKGRIDACKSLGGPVESSAPGGPGAPGAPAPGPSLPNRAPISGDALVVAGILSCG